MARVCYLYLLDSKNITGTIHRFACFGRTLYHSTQQNSTGYIMITLIKTPSEIETMRIPARLAAEALEMVTPYVKPGVTTDELNQICHDYIVNEQQAFPSSLGYHGFPKSMCTSINHVVCHGIPSDRILKSGDILNIDITVLKDGYHGDTSKMFLIGKVSLLAERLVRVTQECLYRGIAVVKPGCTIGDIGAVIQEHAHANRFSVVREYCGHGIGRNLHEDPQILHYGIAGQGMVLEEGMTFTIEPMINAGKAGVKLLSDDWTVVTKDHSLSAQWEHIVLVTKDGHEVLTRRSEEPLL